MMQHILIFFSFFCLGLQAASIEDDYRPTIQNEQRYLDLLGDPFNKRFLSVMLDIRSYHGDGGYTAYNLDEFAWCREQGVKALPLMLEVLKREPTPSIGDSREAWRGLIFKSAALTWIRDFPDGDAKPFLEEVRRQLPAWLELQIAENDSHTGFIGDALEILAREGDASDIPMIESFLNDVNPTNKFNAQKNLAKLKERLAKESEDKTRSRDGIAGNRNPTDESFTDDVKKNHFAETKKFTNRNVISALVIIIMLMIIARMVIKKSNNV